MCKRYLFLLLLVIPFYAPGKKINWVIFDFPPYYIIDDQGQGSGRDESIIRLLAQILPQYEFTYTVFPGSRALHEISNVKNNYCTLSLYKTAERSQKIRFTDNVSTIGLPITIVMRSSEAKMLNISENKMISLTKLLKNNDFTIGVSKGRSYGNAVDKVIAQTKPEKIFIRSGENVLFSLTEMLVKGRIDVVMGYPDEIEYVARKTAVTSQITTLKIQETPTHSEGYIGCTKNQVGYENIKVLNNALGVLYQHSEFYQVLTHWLPKKYHQDVKSLLEKNDIH